MKQEPRTLWFRASVIKLVELLGKAAKDSNGEFKQGATQKSWMIGVPEKLMKYMKVCLLSRMNHT